MAKKLKHEYVSTGLSVEELQKIKLRAEIVKLQEETSQIKKAWYKQPTFLSVLASISVPVLTLVLAYFFGGGKEYFDAQRLNLEYDKKILVSEVENFRKDTIGLNRKYAEASRKLLLAHIRDSISLNSKLKKTSDQLSKVEAELSTTVEKTKYDKLLYSTETLISQFISEGGLWSAVGKSNFDKLIDHIKQTKPKELVERYFDSLTNKPNYDVPVLTKCTTSALFYFVTKEPHWKNKFFACLDANLVPEINSDKKVRSFSVESFITLLHSKYWSKTELHENDKFIIKKVADIFPGYHGDFGRLYEFLMGAIEIDYDYEFSHHLKFSLITITTPDTPRLHYKLCDTLMEPSNDPETFINFLMTCKMFWRQKTLVIYYGNYSLADKFENIFNALLWEKIFTEKNNDDRYVLMNSYEQMIHPNFSFSLSAEQQNQTNSFGREFLQTEIDSLDAWKKRNVLLCTRLNDLQTYRKNIKLLIKDARYNKNQLEDYNLIGTRHFQ